MRSVECPDAAAVFPAELVSAREVQGDFDPRHQVSDQLQVDSDLLQVDSGLALAFAPLVQRRELDSQHLLPPIHSRRGHLFQATILLDSTVGLDFTIFITITSVFLTAASDASRPSSAPDFFGARPTILTTVTTMAITMERRQRNRLS